MNEKDIRDRIGQFLKKTARTVIVPASMGIGLSSTACNGNGIRRADDAGLDVGAAQADTAKPGPDLPEDAIKYDVPMMMVPYVVAMAPDAAAADIFTPQPPYLLPPRPDAATDGTREAPNGDADRDTLVDLQDALPPPPPPYVIYLPPELQPVPPSPLPKKK
jgi:hypothetical protein